MNRFGARALLDEVVREGLLEEMALTWRTGKNQVCQDRRREYFRQRAGCLQSSCGLGDDFLWSIVRPRNGCSDLFLFLKTFLHVFDLRSRDCTEFWRYGLQKVEWGVVWTVCVCVPGCVVHVCTLHLYALCGICVWNMEGVHGTCVCGVDVCWECFHLHAVC